MSSTMPLGPILYQLCLGGSRDAPVVLISSQAAQDDLSYEALKDLYYGLWEVLTGELSETIERPVFSDGQANPKYPNGFDFDFLSIWKWAGARPFIGLCFHDANRSCRISVGVSN